ncbi:MAG: hypothetical protein HUU37_03680, partial [Bdellovibrionales bacterium]|nr:hypothetical protein [Bdellovibrionales bacterium]
MRFLLRRPSVILAVTSVLTTALFFLTWKKWIHAQYDVGFHLYTAWRMSLGDRLYTDLAYSYGPVAPWINSRVISWGGVDALAISYFAASLGILACWIWRCAIARP